MKSWEAEGEQQAAHRYVYLPRFRNVTILDLEDQRG